MKMNHVVRTYNLSGKFIREAHFETAEKAYEDYRNTIENLKKELPKGYGVNVVRFKNEKVMAMETVIGTR